MPRKKIIDYQGLIEKRLDEKRKQLAGTTQNARDLEAEIATLEDLLKQGDTLRAPAPAEPAI